MSGCSYCLASRVVALLLALVPAHSVALEAHAASPAPDQSPNVQVENALSPLSVGIRAGGAFAQHTGTEERDSEYEVASEWREGLTAGVFLYWPITDRFGLQQELVYTQKGSRQKIGVEILEIPTTLDVTYETDYLELPILMRFAWLDLGRGTVYSLMGTALSLRISDRYVLDGELDDGEQVVPIHADSDMSEVDMFDYSFVYGLGYEFGAGGSHVLVEYRFTVGWSELAMPTYAYVPFVDEEVLIENDPVLLKNQTHSIMFGIRF